MKVLIRGMLKKTAPDAFGFAVAVMAFLTCIVSSAVAGNQQRIPAGSDATRVVERADKEGLDLYNRGKLHDAVAIWAKAAELAGHDESENEKLLEMLLHLASAYVRMGSQYFTLAEKTIDRVIFADPNRWKAYMLLGDICYENGEIDCALANYDLLLKLIPAYSNTHMSVAQRIHALQSVQKGVSREPARAGTQRQSKYFYHINAEMDLPALDFYFTIDRKSFLTRIDILQENDAMIAETFLFEEDDLECASPDADARPFEVNDLNGDGYPDVKILCTSFDDTSGDVYLYFLYNRKLKMFTPFEGGILPAEGPSRGVREIRTYERSGDNGLSHLKRIYTVSGGDLILVKETTYDKAGKNVSENNNEPKHKNSDRSR